MSELVSAYQIVSAYRIGLQPLLLQAAILLARGSDEDAAVRYSVLNHPDFAPTSLTAAGVCGSSIGNVINDGVLLMLASLGLRGRSYGDIVADMAATNVYGHNVPDKILAILRGVPLPSRTTHSFDNGRARALELWCPVSALTVVRAALDGSSHVTVVAQGTMCCQCACCFRVCLCVPSGVKTVLC